MRYDGKTGAFLGQFASAGANSGPVDMAFGPDGNLHVTVQGPADGVLGFNGQSGALIDNFVAPGSGGIRNPFGIAFSPVPEPLGFWRRRAVARESESHVMMIEGSGLFSSFL